MEEMEKERSLEKKTKSGLDSHPGATAEAAGLFTDDLILEILSCLPARSVHRFKCVSVPWRNLIADPANRKKLPQTLAGFIYITVHKNSRHHRYRFARVSGGTAPFDPCLPYVQPNKYKDMDLVDTCNGLLLYRGHNNKVTPHAEYDSRFVVCNPATGRWVELPPLPPKPQSPANKHSRAVGLAFDPAVSSHFHVLCFEETSLETHMTGVSIYSSRTGAWSRRDSGMPEKFVLFFIRKSVFVGGMLYLTGKSHINEYVLVGVDMEGRVWKSVHLPYGRSFGTIGSSQGHLHYAIPSVDDNNNILYSEISLWWLKDHDSKELVLKHTASINKLRSPTGLHYRVVEIHPDCNTIFLASRHNTLAAYDMQHQKVGCILNLEDYNTQQFLPYVPLFSESLADADGR